MSTSEPTDGESAADAETAAFVKESAKRTAVLERLVDGDTRVYSLTAKGERILFTLTWDEQ